MKTDLATLEKPGRRFGERVESKTDPADACNMNPDLMKMKTMLEANFDRALEAKYTIRHNTVWPWFVHPLGNLTEAVWQSALRPVLNFGTTFASGQDRFDSHGSGSVHG